jgi:hypothetical protein
MGQKGWELISVSNINEADFKAEYSGVIVPTL